MTSPEETRGILGDAIAAIGFFAIITIALWGATNAIRLAPSLFAVLLPSSSVTATTTSVQTSATTAKWTSVSPAALVSEQRWQKTEIRGIDFSLYATTTTLMQKKTVADKHVTQKSKVTTQAGKPDLSVVIVAVGMIDPVLGSFVERTPIDQTDIGAVRFIVRNVGTAASGSWRFNASLPVSTDDDSYTSTSQASISPGGHITYTLKFNNTIRGAVFSVHVDPVGKLNESRTANNTASVSF